MSKQEADKKILSMTLGKKFKQSFCNKENLAFE